VETINEKLDRLKENVHVLEREIGRHEENAQYLLTEIHDLLTEIEESETIKKGKGERKWEQ